MSFRSKSPVVSLKKLMGSAISMFHTGFNSSKCKTESRLTTARIKLLRNRREAQVRQMRRDIAMLLESGQDSTARIRVEHVIREQNVMAANEIIELFCELIVARLSIIAKQRDCPADLKEGISSLIYAAPRCSEIPELNRIRGIFEKKYGKDFVSAATDLRPNSGVNRMLIEKLSVRKPTGEVKLKIMKEIAKEYQVEWDTTDSELELLKPPEELLEGARSFVSAANMPVKSTTPRDVQSFEPNIRSVKSTPRDVQSNQPNIRSYNENENPTMHFKDTASAAQAAAESAEKAMAAAQAAAYLAKQNSHHFSQTASFGTSTSGHDLATNESRLPKSSFNSQSFNGSHYMYDEKTDRASLSYKQRRHSCTERKVHSDIKFDDSDGLDSDIDEEIETKTPSRGSHPPPNRPPPLQPPFRINHSEENNTPGDSHSSSCKLNPLSRVHPKLPDYEALAARFEALKLRKSLG